MRRRATSDSEIGCSEKREELLRGVGTLRYLFPPNAYVQRQPGGLTIHAQKWLLGAGFLGAPPISLRYGAPEYEEEEEEDGLGESLESLETFVKGLYYDEHDNCYQYSVMITTAILLPLIIITTRATLWLSYKASTRCAWSRRGPRWRRAS